MATITGTADTEHFQEVKTRVDALDLGPIKYKLMDPEEGLGWTRGRTDEVERQYKDFLILSDLSSESPAVPFGDVDKFWHFHILDTHKYAADCQTAFGRFLHHFPYLGMRGEDDKARLQEAGEATQNRYEVLFGARMGGVAATCDRCGASFFGDDGATDQAMRSMERPTVN